MKKRAVVLILVVALFFVVKRKLMLSRAPVFSAKKISVYVCFPKKGDISVYKEYLANVEPERKAFVSTRISAVVEKLFADEGSSVKKGDVICLLDKRDLEAKLSSAKEGLLSAKENYSYWEKEYKRSERLFKEGAISEEQRDRAKNAFFRSRARLKSAQSAVKIAEASISYCEIKAPFDGIVSKRFVDEGDLAMPGKPLFLLEDRSRLKFAFDVPQKDGSLVSKGMEVYYFLRGKKAKAKVVNVFPSYSKNAMLHVEAEIENTKWLKSGELVSIKLLVKSKKNVLLLPKNAVFKRKGKGYFFYVVEKGCARLKKADVGLVASEEVEVKNVKSGDKIVSNPYLSWVKLHDGIKVKIKSEK